MAHFYTGDSADFTHVSQTQQADKDCYIVVSCISQASKDIYFPTMEYSTNGLDWSELTHLYPSEQQAVPAFVEQEDYEGADGTAVNTYQPFGRAVASYATGGASAIEIDDAQAYEGSTSLLLYNDGVNIPTANIYLDINQDYQRFEFWIRGAQADCFGELDIMDGAVYCCPIRWGNPSGKFFIMYGNGAGGTNGVYPTFVIDTWYKIWMDVKPSVNKWRCWVDEVMYPGPNADSEGWDNYYNDGVGPAPDRFRLWARQVGAGVKSSWIDMMNHRSCGVTASSGGISHTLAWDSNTDLGATFDGAVKVRMGALNRDMTGVESAIRETDWFTLDFAAPVYTLGWPNGEIIADATPELHRNASDNSPPIQTKWEIDDDPLFGNANGRKQTQGYSTDSTWTPATLAVMGTWYFRCMCKDSSVSANEGSWVSGSFTLTTSIKPFSITDGVDTVAGFIVDETTTAIENRLREYEADGSFSAGDANIVEWVHRKPCRVLLRMIDGPDPVTGTFDRYAQCLTWMRAKDLLDVEDVGGSPIGFGGLNITYTPSDWTILTIRIINRPGRINLLYYEVLLEEV